MIEFYRPQGGSIFMLRIFSIFFVLLLSVTSTFAETTDTATKIKPSGTVYDKATNEPLVGVNVYAVDSNGTKQNTETGSTIGTSTMSDGTFIFPIPISSNLFVQASYLGYKESRQEPAENMEIFLEENTQDLKEVVVLPTGIVFESGTTNTTENADTNRKESNIVSGVTLQLLGSNGNVIETVTSDNEGRFIFTQTITTGSKIKITHNGYEDKIYNVGDNVKNIQIYIDKITLSGVVLDADTKQPITNANLSLKNANTTIPIGNDGKFKTTTRFTDGETITATYEGYETKTMPVNMGDKITIELKDISLYGIVLNESTQKPIRQAKLQLLDSNDDEIATKTSDISGYFRFTDSIPDGAKIKATRKNYDEKTVLVSEMTTLTTDRPRKQILLTKTQSAPQEENEEDDELQKIIQGITDADTKLNDIIGKLKLSVWKNEEGKFNTARLASDSVAAVVLGTSGGLITSLVMRKKQVENGFEDIKCVIGGQNVANWDEEFNVNIQ